MLGEWASKAWINLASEGIPRVCLYVPNHLCSPASKLWYKQRNTRAGCTSSHGMNTVPLSKALKIFGRKKFYIKTDVNYIVVHKTKFVFPPLKIKHCTFRKFQSLLGSFIPQSTLRRDAVHIYSIIHSQKKVCGERAITSYRPHCEEAMPVRLWKIIKESAGPSAPARSLRFQGSC